MCIDNTDAKVYHNIGADKNYLQGDCLQDMLPVKYKNCPGMVGETVKWDDGHEPTPQSPMNTITIVVISTIVYIIVMVPTGPFLSHLWQNWSSVVLNSGSLFPIWNKVSAGP